MRIAKTKRVSKLYFYAILTLLVAQNVTSPIAYANNDDGFSPRREIGCEIDYGDGTGGMDSYSKSRAGRGKGKGDSDLFSSEFAGLGNAGGPWIQEGTKEHEIARLAFEILTEEYGLSGYSASGWLGNIQSESGFNPNIVEAENGQNYAGRGFGLFQFTPAEKYTQSKFYNPKASLEESVRSQIAFVWQSEFQNQVAFSMAKNYVAVTYPEIGSKWFDHSKLKPEDFLDSESPEKAMYLFFAGYERGDYYQMHEDRRRMATQVADKLFNKNKVKADPSKWKFGEGINDDYTPRVIMPSGLVDGDECEDVTAKRQSNAPTDLIEKWQAVLAFNKGIDWDGVAGSQCFDIFEYYIAEMLTDKDGNRFKGFNFQSPTGGANAMHIPAKTWGQGWEVRENAKPDDIRAGDILNGTMAGATGQGAEFGHVIVVLSNPDENGEFLYVDQNPYRPSINKGSASQWATFHLVSPPNGFKMVDDPVQKQYINDAVPAGNGVGWLGKAPNIASDEDIARLGAI